MPLPDRALTAVLLSSDGHTILFDCGEGTQSAARKAEVSLMKVEIIALTHYHGDHIFGLPGLLQSMSCLGRTQDLLITGPSGIEKALSPIMDLAGNLSFKVTLKEMTEPIEIYPEAVLSSFKTRHRCQSIGYKFSLGRPGMFNAEKAAMLGVDKSDWGKLQHGISVGDVTPEMVLGKRRDGLNFVFSGDTMPCDSLAEASRGADLLICEATYAEDDMENQAREYGHMTYSQACSVGKEAKRTVLAHFSQVIEDPSAYELPDGVEPGTDGLKIELNFASRIPEE